MECNYACGSDEHLRARRQFLGQLAYGGLAAGLGTGLFTSPASASVLAIDQKRVLLFYMAGGLSQLESWDPKPGAATGGPFRSIPTSVPGVHISELLPETAKIMDKLLIVRGLNTAEDDHLKGQHLMLTGRRQQGAENHPRLGAVVTKALQGEKLEIPAHIHITPGGGGGRSADSAYLGPQYASIVLGNGSPPAHTTTHDGLTVDADAQRHALRCELSQRLLMRRRTAQTDAYLQSYDQALRMMQRRDAFDIAQEPEKDRDRYGSFDLGRHCLLARRLLEQGAMFVQVSHSNYDTHNENFDFHIEQMGEFDRSFSNIIRDLDERGMLESTLVIVMSEFGRTPNINLYYGRDHWSKAWSVALAGAGLQVGGVYGATNADGTEVVDKQVNHGQLFHTYLQALGLDSTGSFHVEGRDIPMADPAEEAIFEILS